jgi:plastocyanin
VNVGHGGTYFIDQTSGTSTTTVHVGDTVSWVWEGDLSHGTSSGTCTGGGGGGYGGYGGGGCAASGTFASNVHKAPYSYSYKFEHEGTFNYFCDVHQDAMKGRVIVSPIGQ